MKQLIFAALGSIILAVVPDAAFANSSLPQRAAPAGFTSRDGAHGGRLLSGTIKGPFSSSNQALAATLHRLRAYFTGSLPITSAVESNHRLIVFFRGHLDAVPVVGLTAIEPESERGAVVASIFDTPERAATSLSHFTTRAHSSDADGAASSDAVALTRQRLADGSASIGIPAGWRIISGSRGMVDVMGSDGAEAHIGIQFPVWDPRAGLADPTKMQVPFTADPVAAALAVRERTLRISGKEPPPTDILGVHPVAPPMGAGRAALVHGRVGGAIPLEFVTLANSAPLSKMAWMFYATTVWAPPQYFSRDYPVMIAIWQSYQPDGAYLRELRSDTDRTLSEAANIVNSATQRSIVAGGQSSAGMDNLINGDEVFATMSDGTHWLGNADAARALSEKYPDKYRVVPIDQYTDGDY